MWEDGLGKVKTRRTKISKPYERPKSILRRVTESVTGLLPQPSWLVNWLQSSNAKEEETNEESEQEQPIPSTSSSTSTVAESQSNRESFIFRRPPGSSKEQRNNGLNPLNLPVGVPSIETNNLETAISSREISIQSNGDDDSHSESTSGCSSLVPHPDHHRRDVELNSAVEPLSMDQPSLRVLGRTLSKSLAADLKNSRGRKTLSLHNFSANEDIRLEKDSEVTGSSSFFTKDELSSTSLGCSAMKRDLQPQMSSFSSKRPRFNVTSFGPSLSEARKSMLNESVVDSPFYAGRTTFGGASAYRRAALQPSATPFPYIRNRMTARASSSVSSAPATPVGSASASSNVVLSSSAHRILLALEAISTPVRDAKRIPGTSRNSFRDEDVSFTGFGLSRRRPNLGPPASKLASSTPVHVVPAQLPPAPAPVVTKKTIYEETDFLSSTPIHNNNNSSSKAGGKMRSKSSAPPRESRLREEMEEAPVFSTLQPISMPIDSLPSFGLLPQAPPIIDTATAAVAAAAPKALKEAIPCIPLSVTSFNGPTERSPFTFAAPEITVCSATASAAVTSNPPVFVFRSPEYVRQSPESRNPRPVTPVASQLRTGSVMDILGVKKDDQQPKITQETTAKAAKATDLPVAPISQGFGDQFKAPTDTWMCAVCCVNNPNAKSVCLACETPKPGSSKPHPAPPAALPAVAAAPKGFGDQFKMSASQWECSICLVRNSDAAVQCTSCESSRPGSLKAAAAPVISAFKFGVSHDKKTEGAAFKFGVPADVKPVEKKEDATGGFKFGASVEPSPTPAAGFKFGASVEPSPTPAAAASAGFKFGASVEPSTTVTTSAGFKFGASVEPSPTPALAASAGFKFGASVEPSKTVTASSGFKFGVQTSEKVKEDAEIKKPEDSAEKGFSFGASLEPAAKKDSTPSAGFSFGVPVEPKKSVTSLEPVATKEAPAFSFGAAPVEVPKKEAPAFSFGAAAPVEAKKEAPAFSFGAAAPVELKKPTFGGTSLEPAAKKEAPAFSFGTATEPKTTSFGSLMEPVKEKTPAAAPVGLTAPSFGSFTSTPVISAPEEAPKPASIIRKAEEIIPSTSSPAFSFLTGPKLDELPSSRSSPFVFGSSSTSLDPSAAKKTSLETSLFGGFGAPASTTSFKAAAPAPAAAAFSFGNPSTTSTVTTSSSTSSSPFVFGAPTSSASSAAAPGLFTFGASATPAAAPAAPAASFTSFGASAPPPAYPFSSKETPKSFAFAAAPIVAPTPVTSAPPFAFGAPEAPKSLFNMPTVATTSALSSFGSFTQTPATSATPFGSNPPGFGEPPSFSFGASAAVPAFSGTPNFNFGAPAGPAVAPAQPIPAASIFTFGTPAPNSGAGSFYPSSGDSAGLGQSFNVFEMSGSAPGPGRKIRKAVRRR